jgi:hypothetical protein
MREAFDGSGCIILAPGEITGFPPGNFWYGSGIYHGKILFHIRSLSYLILNALEIEVTFSGAAKGTET